MAQTQQRIKLNFELLDHQPCRTKAVLLRGNGSEINLTLEEDVLIIPASIDRFLWAGHDGEKFVDLVFRCDARVLAVPQVHESWLKNGHWSLSEDYPPFQGVSGGLHVHTHGIWEVSLGFEPEGSDGVEVRYSRSDVPPGLLEKLKGWQGSKDAVMQRDAAFGLALIGQAYEENRTYLSKLFASCIKDESKSPDCDPRASSYLANLYWRGDVSLLQQLLAATTSKSDAAEDLEIFYEDLLSHYPEVAEKQLQLQPDEVKLSICERAVPPVLRPAIAARLVANADFFGKKGHECQAKWMALSLVD